MELQLQPAQALPVRRFSFPARLLIALAAGLAVGALVAALSPGDFLPGLLAAGLLAWGSVYLLLLAWEWGGADRTLAWLIALAFILRLGLGIFAGLALPVWGYPDEPVQQAGYLFKDAYARDHQAWSFVTNGDALAQAFAEDLYTDQYGGLLAVSAAIYRYLSPDAHRPLLPLILGAMTAAAGVAFLRQGIRLRWPGRVAAIAAWIYVLYPDAVFFAGAQMREPFLVGLSAIAFWAVLALDPSSSPAGFLPAGSVTAGSVTAGSAPARSLPLSLFTRRSAPAWLALFFSLLVMLIFSSRVAAAVAGLLGLLFMLEYLIPAPGRKWEILGWAGLAVGVIVLLAFSWNWFRSSAGWDAVVSLRSSGSIKVRVQEISKGLHVPDDVVGMAIMVTYGLARPVLPAAVAETSIPFWKTVAIVRSAGWYALAPFLIYALFVVWREPDRRQRRRLLWLALVIVMWLAVASARGGGDATDNPRYRSLFIIWLALLAAWAIDHAITHKDAWLWRWLAVEVIFLTFFTHWYLSRYYHLWARLEFWPMVAWIVALSTAVLGGGWFWDRRKAVQPKA